MGRYPLTRLLLAALFCQASPAGAVDYSWMNSIGGSFLEPSNWDPYAPPATQGPGGANDTVGFDLGVLSFNRYVVTDVGGENDQLLIHNDYVELSIFPNYTLSSAGGANPSLVVGATSGDRGDVILSGDGALSALETRVTRIGNVAGSTGVVRASGLEWNGGNLRVGYAGDGTLVIEDDASLASTNASLAHLTGGRGDATILGRWDVSGALLVGREGDGFFDVSTDGIVTSNVGLLGDQSSGYGQAFVGATWTIANELTVGNSGEGLLTIGNTASVSNGDALIGRLPGSIGQVLAVAGSQWTTNGRLSIGGNADTGLAGGVGEVDILGGEVTISEDIVIFPNSEIVFDGGSLTVPTMTLQGGVFDWVSGTLMLDEFNGNLTSIGGLLAAREVAGSITINGNFVQDGGLDVDIVGEAAAGEHSTFHVTGTSHLEGLLLIEVDPDYMPTPNETYVVLEAGAAISGSFGNAVSGQRVADANRLGSFLIHYGPGSPFDPNQVVLTDFQRDPNADFDGDGDVDGDDLVQWQAGFSASGNATHMQGDADFDLDVDGNDFLWWQRLLNDGPPAVGASAPTPEPASFALCGLAAAVLPRFGRRSAPLRRVPLAAASGKRVHGLPKAVQA